MAATRLKTAIIKAVAIFWPSLYIHTKSSQSTQVTQQQKSLLYFMSDVLSSRRFQVLTLVYVKRLKSRSHPKHLRLHRLNIKALIINHPHIQCPIQKHLHMLQIGVVYYTTSLRSLEAEGSGSGNRSSSENG